MQRDFLIFLGCLIIVLSAYIVGGPLGAAIGLVIFFAGVFSGEINTLNPNFGIIWLGASMVMLSMFLFKYGRKIGVLLGIFTMLAGFYFGHTTKPALS